ncbi:hypothetical protein HL13_gp84 [Dinoroseobacter phage DFL12phi1]|uniref:Uncharacterized protein n=2 Tax=Baltimorevirus DFL12 TaxID=2169868 RepID=A0A023NHX2_9CAUD|nr:hypothetical protein HL13_gp84 [Dinoroseobacter phage DFL12phi1]AHX01044.1 hypothetical protein DFL12P1_0084 [Dinoroseobacter phage DFL12phi1]AID16817.1 hypothetical protein vBDshPR2C_01 [Dinoroseobacter phage vBDshPR2C]
MGMFKSAQRFVSTTFDIGTEVVESVGQSVSMATTYVDNRAKAQKISDRQLVIDSLTETLAPIREKLNTDEAYAALYAELEAEFDK